MSTMHVVLYEPADDVLERAPEHVPGHIARILRRWELRRWDEARHAWANSASQTVPSERSSSNPTARALSALGSSRTARSSRRISSTASRRAGAASAGSSAAVGLRQARRRLRPRLAGAVPVRA